ncbi:hypothetical protein B0H15DRAFT_956484 [Mycena belliarum]|uniref:Uncharacterized protein n=1 Tax=Mycena belliarum TaxID=1033014 RepID=A0AAD6XJG9_9AGAR|nr:hypothetical protein B0H15DRAFT_956484 [Mycena belliae]
MLQQRHPRRAAGLRSRFSFSAQQHQLKEPVSRPKPRSVQPNPPASYPEPTPRRLPALTLLAECPASLAARYPAPRGSEECCRALRPPPTFPARPRCAAQSRPYYAPTVTLACDAPSRPIRPAYPLPPHTSPPASNSSRSRSPDSRYPHANYNASRSRSPPFAPDSRIASATPNSVTHDSRSASRS